MASGSSLIESGNFKLSRKSKANPVKPGIKTKGNGPTEYRPVLAKVAKAVAKLRAADFDIARPNDAGMA
jgi:hypothetical protein